MGVVHKMLTKDIGYRKISARWIPHSLNEKQKANCVSCAKKRIIKLFKKRKNLLFSGIVIADITWVHYFQPQSNIQFDNNKIWITKDRKRPVIAKRC